MYWIFFYINKLELYLSHGFYFMLEDMQQPVSFLESLSLISLYLYDISWDLRSPWLRGRPPVTNGIILNSVSANSYPKLNWKKQFMEVSWRPPTTLTL